MDKTLYNAARAGHLILTVNKRLARTLVNAYDLVQQEQGLGAWLRPEIMSFAAWLSRCVQQLPDAPVFLNRAQRQHVWEGIIEDDLRAAGVALLQVPQTARRAHQAHQLLVQHEASFTGAYAAEDHRAFLRWRAAWQSRAAEHDWYDPVELPDYIRRAIAEGRLKAPASVIVAGFDDLPPDLQRLLSGLEGAGATIDVWQPPPCREVSRRRVAAHDRQDEVALCARWVRGVLSHRPTAKIGVIVPQLESYLAEIEHSFAAELAPETLLSGDRDQTLFNCSLGQGLDGEGVVHAAMKLLRIGNHLGADDVTWLLCTPYLRKAETEAAARALLDRELKRARIHGWPITRLEKVIHGLAERQSFTIPGLLAILKTLVAAQQERRKRHPGDWAEHFTRTLQTLGWPGERTVSSREYQAIEHFRSALGELASLDGVSGPVERSEAARLLARIVAAQEFQPEGGDAPVQILGLLESGGLSFDCLWILGMTDAAVPSPPNPNPFLPLPLQRTHQMKRADIAREYRFAEQLVERLFHAAPEVVVSCPLRENGAILRPSPFLAALPLVELPAEETSAPDRFLWQHRPVLEEQLDAKAPEIVSRKAFAGGTGIIKDQAICPFRAFAHHRLRAEQMETADIGLDNMSRGTLAHAALELFWAEVKDQATLLAMDASCLDRQVEKAIGLALERHERERRYDIPARQRAIEVRRLHRIVLQWLAIEGQRGPFRVAEAEKTHHIKVGDLTIRTRIDRVDSLPDGRRAIIDYKTGRPDPSQWLDQRITEPQLPLYCLSMPAAEVGAVMFAEVRSKLSECGFRGLARDVETWPGARSRKLEMLLEAGAMLDFDAVLAHWQQALPALGDAFARGEAAVDPVEGDLACTYCDLTVLCRILEQHHGTPGESDD